ncbi:MAG TPA: malto-oligosyltrehalose synthase, partial [Polyangiaceae bacterium]|nr:malto-oligosyltrehalose synthase [Polyangiaceae bacterium]
HVYQSKHQILRYSLASEVNMLGRALERIANVSRRWRDFTLISLTRALIEILAAFPVYRTYLREGQPPSEHDERRVLEAIRAARRNNPALNPSLFQFIEEVLLLRVPATEPEHAEHQRFALRFQQLTGPVKAKAVEDTAFYRYNRLVCLNEVGNDPERFGGSIESFHAQNAERARAWPLGMVATSTHDTKRGEDASARIAVLSEMPEIWRRTLRAFGELATASRGSVDGKPAPSGSLEYLFYQTLVGAWPLADTSDAREPFILRMKEFMRKASKEAKQQTSWTSPNAAYDAATEAFVDEMLRSDAFLDEVRKLSRLIAPYGAANSLALTLLKHCSPGVPDTYQGSELWNQSLVDPDNRRPVDFEERRSILATLVRERARDPRALARTLLDDYADGRIKLYTTHVALVARQRAPELFRRGDYEALLAGEHVVAFTRSAGTQRLICATARLSYQKTAGRRPFAVGTAWDDERLRVPHAGRYRELLTERVLDLGLDTRLSELFLDLPVALLLQEERQPRSRR